MVNLIFEYNFFEPTTLFYPIFEEIGSVDFFDGDILQVTNNEKMNLIKYYENE